MPKPEHSLKEIGLYSGISKEKYRDLKQRVILRHPERYIPTPTIVQIDAEYDSMNDEQLAESYDKLLDGDPVLWQKDAVKEGGLAEWIFNTGNTALLTQILDENSETLTYEQQHILKSIISSTGKKAEIQNQAKEIMQEGERLYRPANVVYDNDGGVTLEDVYQKEFQNTAAGCWANFFQVLASSKGIDLTQNDIKNYRPDKSLQEAQQVTEDIHNAYNADRENNALEMADSILSFMPNTMLREVEIAPYNDAIKNENITEEQFKKSAIDEMSRIIRNAIEFDRSPVGVLMGGHYITIIGINGDKVKYKDSLYHDNNKTEPDKTHEGTLSELLGDKLSAQSGMAGLSGIQLTWMKDIQLSKDGKTIFGVPSEYVEMNPDGTLTEQPELIKDGAKNPGNTDLNRLGTAVYRYAGKEDTESEQHFRPLTQNNIIIHEKAYLPKVLNADYLKDQAEKRSLRTENLLRKNDREQMGLDRKEIESLENIPLATTAQRRSNNEILMANEQANETIRERMMQSRRNAIDNGIASIVRGEHPELTGLKLLNRSSYGRLTDIPDYEIREADRLLRAAIGKDTEGNDVIGLNDILDGFTYKPSPDSEPISLVESVRAQLVDSRLLVNDKNPEETVYRYARAELLRLMTTPGAELTYTNGDHKIGNIFTDASLYSLRSPERIESICNGSTPEGRQLAETLQSLDLEDVETGLEIPAMLLKRDPKDIKKLAEIYDKIFIKDQYHFEGYNIDEFSIDLGSDEYGTSLDTESLYLNSIDPETDTRTYDEKHMFKKAMVITALINNITVADNDAGVMPSMYDAVNGENTIAYKRERAREQLTGEDLDFSDRNIPGKTSVKLDYDIEMIQNTVSQMAANITRNDKWYIRSSGKFRDMKAKLADLNDLVNVTWAQKLANNRAITFEDMNEFLEKSDALKSDMKKYLEYKNGQMCKDPGRRKSGDTYEQKRIKASLDSFTKLNDMTKKVEEGILNSISAGAKEFFKADLALQENVREQAVKESMDAYKVNVYRSALRTNQLEPDFYTRRMVGSRKETLSEARDRINSRLDKKYTIADVNALKAGSPMYKTVNDAAYRYEVAKEIFSNEMIKSRYNESYDILTENAVIKDIDDFDAERYRCDTLARDKKTLLENSTKNATNLPLNRIKSVELIDYIYGFKPEYQERFKQYSETKVTGEEYKIFKPIKNDFKNVYKTSDPNEVIPPLSEKDFAAIAMAAAAQKEAYDLVTSKSLLKEQLEKGEITADQYKYNYKVLNDSLPDDMSMMFSTTHYTTGICDDDGTISDQVVRSSFPCIQKGRELAADALNAYKEGNLDPLAKIIAMSLNNAIRRDMNTLNIGSAPETGEMAKRLCNLMERDSDLKQRVLSYPLGNDKTLDRDYEQKIDSISTWGLIVDKCSISKKILANTPQALTESQQIAAKADIYIVRLFNDQYDDIISNKLKKDPRVIADKEQTNHLATDKLKDPNTPDYEKEYYNKLYCNVKDQIYPIMFPHQNKLLEGIGKPGAYDALKAEVVKMIKSTTLKDMNYKEYTKYLDMLSKPKFDTDMSSSLTYLKNYKKEPKVNGIYQAKNFFKYDGNYFEDGERAREIIEEKSQMQQEPQIQNPQNNAPKRGNS